MIRGTAQLAIECNFLIEDNNTSVEDKAKLKKKMDSQNPNSGNELNALIDDINNKRATIVIANSTQDELNAENAGLTRISSNLTLFIQQNKSTLLKVNLKGNFLTLFPRLLLTLPKINEINLEENYLSDEDLTHLIDSNNEININIDSQREQTVFEVLDLDDRPTYTPQFKSDQHETTSLIRPSAQRLDDSGKGICCGCRIS